LEEIKKAGVQAASLTRQLLAFSRQQVLAPQRLDLNILVTDLEMILRRLIGDEIDLALVRDAELGRVKADPGQINQIFMNLAINARDAMPQERHPPGEGVPRAEAEFCRTRLLGARILGVDGGAG
jgi:two-component system, cell cycle sensor histidine kinase and response regulator CckA